MNKKSKIISIIILSFFTLLTLTGCNLLKKLGLFGKEEDNRVLTAYIEGECYVDEPCKLFAKWDNGEYANDVNFQTTSDISAHIIYENNLVCLHAFQAGIISIVATAEQISSLPLQVRVHHTATSLEKLLTASLANPEIDVPCSLNIEEDAQLSVELVDTQKVALLQGGALTFKGIGAVELVIKKSNGDILLTYPVNIYNPLTLTILSELKRTGVIEPEAEHALSADFEEAEELNLAGKLFGSTGVARMLAKFKNLKYLNIAGCNLYSLNFLADINDLEYLDASGNLIKTLEHLAGCNKLEYLDISDNLLTHIGFAWIYPLPSLKTLNVAGNEIPSDFEELIQEVDLLELETEDYTKNTPETLADFPQEELAVFDSLTEYIVSYINGEGVRKPNVIINIANDDYSSSYSSILVPKETLRIEIIGIADKTGKMNKYISISSRQNALTLIIQDLKLNAPSGHSAIEAPLDSALTIVVKGCNEMQGNMGKHGICGGYIEITSTKTGTDAHSLIAKGGAGAEGSEGRTTSSDSNGTRVGGMGGNGGCGLIAYKELIIRHTHNLRFEGGNGGKGGQGGKYKADSLDPNKWLKQHGDGGRGGAGGDGYKCPNAYYLIGENAPALQGGAGGAGGQGRVHSDNKFSGKAGQNGVSGQEAGHQFDSYFNPYN